MFWDMTRRLMPAAILGTCAVLGACAQMVQGKEDMLAAAGFSIVPANTPQRQTALAAMPPHKFVHQIRGGRMLYAYADPTICDEVDPAFGTRGIIGSGPLR